MSFVVRIVVTEHVRRTDRSRTELLYSQYRIIYERMQMSDKNG